MFSPSPVFAVSYRVNECFLALRRNGRMVQRGAALVGADSSPGREHRVSWSTGDVALGRLRPSCVEVGLSSGRVARAPGESDGAASPTRRYFPLTGTIINAIAVVAAGIVGTLLGDRLPERVRQTVMAGIGLTTLLIGVQMALKTEHLLIVLGEHRPRRDRRRADRTSTAGWSGSGAGSRLGSARSAGCAGSPAPAATSLARFVTASLVFCVGPMTIVGSIQDGLTGDYQTLAVKSMLDAFTGLAFASSLGIGVAFSALTVLVYQGALTLGAGWVKDAADRRRWSPR